MILCPSEGTMYLKTLQGGAPTLIVHSIAPYEAKIDSPPEPQPDYGAQIAELRAQVEALQKKQKGGSFNELIQSPTNANAIGSNVAIDESYATDDEYGYFCSTAN